MLFHIMKDVHYHTSVIKINLGKKDILEHLKCRNDNIDDDGMELSFNPKIMYKYAGIHAEINECIM